MRLISTASRKLRLLSLRSTGRGRPSYECPICGYTGPFLDFRPSTGLRKHATCPGCGSMERHRVQWLTLKALSTGADFRRMRVLHLAPEAFFRKRFAAMFGSYATADLNPRGVDYRIDLTKPLPLAPGSFDLVYASHVLEHIQRDEVALTNIRLLLSSTGIAILPVPILAESTIEYPAPNPAEADHVRAPGRDYYQRYEKYFSGVRLFSSTDFDDRFQLFVFEDRSCWPTPDMPLRPAMQGGRFPDTVPVCMV